MNKNQISTKIDDFFEWLTTHDEIAKYLLIDSLFLPHKESELKKTLEKREKSHQETLERLKNFFYYSLISSSPHEPIPFQVSKFFIPKEISKEICKTRFISLVHHKAILVTFNKAVKMCSELISLYSSENIIPLNVRLNVIDEFYTDILVKSPRAVFTDTYIKSCLQDSVKVIKNSLITTASREYLEGIIKNVLPKYDSHTHYFPICKEQEDFSSFLFSLRNKAYDTIKSFIEKFRTFKRSEFTENALVVFNEVATDYQITNKKECNVMALLFIRSIYDRCIEEDQEYFFAPQREVDPSFFDNVKCSDILLPEYFSKGREEKKIREEIMKIPKLADAANELVYASFLTCPQDVLNSISTSLSFIREELSKQKGMIDFDSCFGIFFATFIAAGSPEFLTTCYFVEEFTPEKRTIPEHQTALMMYVAAKKQLLTMIEKVSH